ncbi:MAG: creatininase family protein [Anaerolineales bacterium]
MRFEELNWMDVEEYLRHDDRLMLVLGATEQHGYLSLLTDVKIPLALADAASQQSGVLVAPPLNFGVSPYFLAYPGTLSLRAATLAAVIEDITRSLYAAGFRRLLVLNGHGGNQAADAALTETMNSLPGLRANWYEWWNSHSVEAIGLKYELKPNHANWVEAFPFTRVAELPAEPKIPPFVPGLTDAKTTREIYGDGVFGGAYQADDAVMAEVFSACLADVLKMLEDL